MRFKVLIDTGYDFGLNTRIAICVTDFEGKIMQVAKPIILEFADPPPRGHLVTPTLDLPFDYGHDLLEAFAQACNKANIKPPEPHRLEGKIESLTYHLEDLRTLLKLRKP